jgi:3-oxoadipate enol-lactonase
VDASEATARIRVPTLVISGGEDHLLPEGRRLAAAIPGARFEILEGADHIEACCTDPRLMQMVSAFLAEDRLE